jgi:hypothetical protein
MLLRIFFVGALIGACVFNSWPVRADFQGATHIMPFDEDTIAYSKSKSTGPVAKLQERIDKGEVTLKRDEQFGFLLSILEQLKAPKASQMLVFSKTSFQRERIDPKHPRAVFFGDDVYLGASLKKRRSKQRSKAHRNSSSNSRVKVRVTTAAVADG